MNDQNPVAIEKPTTSGSIANGLGRSLISDATLVGGMTLLGYVTTFSYLRGEAEALGIPSELISVSLENCLTVLLILFLSAGGLFGWAEVVSSAFPERFRRRVYVIFLLMLGVISIALVLAILVSPAFYLAVVLLGLALIGVYVAPLFEHGKEGGYVDRLDAKLASQAANKKDVIDQSVITKWLASRIGRAPIFVLFFSLISMLTAYQLGEASAWYEPFYFVSLSPNPDVLLARYGDMLVFRRKGSPEIIIRVIGKDGIPPLVRKNIGSMAMPTLTRE